jgi:hypothetical protein
MSDQRKPDQDKVRQIAKEYVDRQLRDMQKSGLQAEDVSREEYEAIVDDVAETITQT